MSALAPFTVKLGDTYQTIWTTELDLTGATVRLLAKHVGTKAVTELACTIHSTYSVSHYLTGTLPVGDYWVELEATKNGRKVTSPTSGFLLLRVEQDNG